MAIGSSIFQLAYEISPIVLVGGIIPGGMLPIVAITESASFLQGILSGGSPLDLDNHFAHFQPMPGATLIDYQVAMYPFANQAVAANAMIAQPTTLSLLMICPAKGRMGYPVKLATMIALREVLKRHNASGGTYIVITPSIVQPNCLLTSMRDISPGNTRQPHIEWQLDFIAPLLTTGEAQSIMSSLMNKISGGTEINGAPTWSNVENTVGAPNSVAAQSVVPSASSLPAASVTPNIAPAAPSAPVFNPSALNST